VGTLRKKCGWEEKTGENLIKAIPKKKSISIYIYIFKAWFLIKYGPFINKINYKNL